MSDNNWEVAGKVKSGKKPFGVHTNKVFKDKNNENKNKTNTLQVPKPKSRSMSPQEKDENDSKPANQPATKQKNSKRKSIPVIQLSRAKPKNIEIELANLNLDELIENLEMHKESFPGSKLIWLKSILSYLNANLHLETDPVFAGKPINYPYTAVPNNLKAIIYDTLNDAGIANVQYFYDQTLTSLVVDLSCIQGCLGHKIMLQMIALKWPSVCTGNLAKSVILRVSYENRAAIGLALLWSLGQGGFRDINVGLRVWLNLMTAVIERKAYTKYVVEYLENIIENANCYDNSLILTEDELFAIVSAIEEGFKISREYLIALNKCVQLLLIKFARDTPTTSRFFMNLLKKYTNQNENEFVYALNECLLKDDGCFTAWQVQYKKHYRESLLLLANIKDGVSEIKERAVFTGFLQHIINDFELSKKQNLCDIHDIAVEIRKKNQQEKSQKKSKSSSSSSCCPWLIGSVLLLGAIGGLLAFDTQRNGGVFEKSATGKFLKDTGALPYVEVAWTKTLSTSARGYQWAEVNVPVYANKTYTVLKPYGEVAKDLGIVGWNAAKNGWKVTQQYAASKTPVVVNFIEQYAPGLPQKVSEISISTWNVVSSTASSAYTSSSEFLKAKVFVGSLSPENLRHALNQTQIAVANYYTWFHKQVDGYAKIK